MKNVEFRMNGGARHVLKLFFILHFSFFIFSARADDFGDISVSAQAMFTGNTYHGYGETRVIVENHSSGKTHVVTLTIPKDSRSRGAGNSISRISRTVKLAPGAREIVPLLQPALPAYGDGALGIEVDNNLYEEGVRVPNANNHCNFYSRGSQPSTLFISRSLDYDAVSKMFNAGRGAFTAEMATGSPDAAGGGIGAKSWTPDTRRGITAQWLELDYATPRTATQLSIHNTQPPSVAGFIELTGVSGTNILKIPMTSGRSSSSSGGWIIEFNFPETREAVKTVRLDFGKVPPYNLAIDAVEIIGPSGRDWAAHASASSDNSASAGSYSPGGVTAETIQTLQALAPAGEWSENWLAYTPFDAIALDAADLNGMRPGVLNALTDYLMAGGNIFLAGQKDVPAVWNHGQKKSFSKAGEIAAGFGHLFVSGEKNFADTGAKSIQNLRDHLRDASVYWQSLPEDNNSANAIFPVVENLKIPVRGIVVIMLAFIILIGPVNVIYLTRKKRRTWMLWTIPAISFATTLLVFAYSLLREGITPDTRIAGVTVLDQASHHATTVGATAFYCPLTPSGGLRFDFGTEATPLLPAGYGSGSAREIDWTQSQHLTHGWVSARVPAYFHLRKTETRRERIQIVNENGKLQVVNSLGAGIKSLWFADADMNYYQAFNIGAGQKIALGRMVERYSGGPGTAADALLRDVTFATHAENLNELSVKYLSPNSYIAVLDANPFLENGLGSSASVKRTKSSAVVFGMLESPQAR